MTARINVRIEMEPDIIDQLRDLYKQATTERSHYYVAKCCEAAIQEIEQLRCDKKMLAESINAMRAEFDNVLSRD